MNMKSHRGRFGAIIAIGTAAAAPDSHKVILKSPHIHYHQPGNIVRDVPSTDSPVHPGLWSVHWMKPEPMHAIETIESNRSPNAPPFVRVEIKVPTSAG